MLMTGIETKEEFVTLYDYVNAGFSENVKYRKGWPVARISTIDQLFLTLVKLRRGYTDRELSLYYKVTISQFFIALILNERKFQEYM